MEAKDNIARYRKSQSAGGGGYGERLARLEVHVRHLKENSATKEDIATVNGRLDTVSEALKNLVTKDDLRAGRRRLTTAIIATATLFVGLAAVVALLGYIERPPAAEPSRFLPRGGQAVPPPATLDAGAFRTG